MVRIAILKKEKCKAPFDCPYICEGVCPVNRTGKECIKHLPNKKPEIDEKLCIGCGICVKKCPFEAITIINLPEELDQEPIHQYGKNGFRLYNLPIPLFGKVVGILGKNGIGKSTAIKILAGVEKPNFGKEKESDYKALIEFFKGTEAQIFFEKVSKGEIKISYKPQQVDAIPKIFKGTVRELLKKSDEKGIFNEITETLQLKNILDTEISKISGGELQRTAIAACVMKKANFYVFDEPTSYLDIKQRIKISKFIKELATPDVAVMVVEHDLIILDYMTDMIHLMYGKEDAYGVVSLPRATRTGINLYLDGFLKEENIKFRDYEIRFEAKPPSDKKHIAKLSSWTEIKKKLGNFSLESENGTLFMKNVVGVLGENGIGKTTFIKLLAGVESPDKGDIDIKIKVSYKPQYIDTASEELVMNLLQEAIIKHDIDIIRPLQIKPLFMKKLKELSGGELQRVAIAECLSKDADLYLLDEPSAYLDVEQRIALSKTIKSFIEMNSKTALIVDHDLLFIDYISNDLMVFDGIPAVKGIAKGPFSMKDGMNLFLKDLNITMRRDLESHRPRVNKEDSQLDKKQKEEGNLYYS